MNKDVIIVGAGASGLICGCALDDRAVILEATPRAGTKLLMAGSGRCLQQRFRDPFSGSRTSFRQILWTDKNIRRWRLPESGSSTGIQSRLFPRSAKNPVRHPLAAVWKPRGNRVLSQHLFLNFQQGERPGRPGRSWKPERLWRLLFLSKERPVFP